MADNQAYGAVYVNTSRVEGRVAFLVVCPVPEIYWIRQQGWHCVCRGYKQHLAAQWWCSFLMHSPSVGSVAVYHWEVPFCRKITQVSVYAVWMSSEIFPHCQQTPIDILQEPRQTVIWPDFRHVSYVGCEFAVRVVSYNIAKMLAGWPWLFSDFSRPQPISVPIQKLGSKRNSDIATDILGNT